MISVLLRISWDLCTEKGLLRAVETQPMDYFLYFQLRAIVDMCAVQNFWGPFEPNSYTSEFAPIVRVLTADEIMAISGSPTDIESVCEYAGSYTDNQV